MTYFTISLNMTLTWSFSNPIEKYSFGSSIVFLFLRNSARASLPFPNFGLMSLYGLFPKERISWHVIPRLTFTYLCIFHICSSHQMTKHQTSGWTFSCSFFLPFWQLSLAPTTWRETFRPHYFLPHPDRVYQIVRLVNELVLVSD